MKFTKKEFLSAPLGKIAVDEWIAVEENDLLHHTQVKSIPKVHITGDLQYDGSTLVYSNLELEGVMIVLDSITLEDLEVEFDTESHETYSFVPIKEERRDEEVIVVKHDTIDINRGVSGGAVRGADEHHPSSKRSISERKRMAGDFGSGPERSRGKD